MKECLVAVLAVLLLLLGALVPLVMSRSCPITRAACERIVEGMTRAEVEEILGVPPGDYRTQPGKSFSIGFSWRLAASEEWIGDEAELYVSFDAGGRGNGRVLGDVAG